MSKVYRVDLQRLLPERRKLFTGDYYVEHIAVTIESHLFNDYLEANAYFNVTLFNYRQRLALIEVDSVTGYERVIVYKEGTVRVLVDLCEEKRLINKYG